jgi:hypothetical protein
MSISLKTEIIGGKELERALRELGEAAGQKGGPVKLALKHAAEPTLAAMKARVARHSETRVLLNSLESKRHPNPKYLNEIYGVGVHKPGKRPPKGQGPRTTTPWYAWVVEYGGWHKSHPLKGFARGSLETTRAQATAIYASDLGKGINKLAKKIGNKNAQVIAAKVKAARSLAGRGTLGPLRTRTSPSGLKIRTNF